MPDRTPRACQQRNIKDQHLPEHGGKILQWQVGESPGAEQPDRVGASGRSCNVENEAAGFLRMLPPQFRAAAPARPKAYGRLREAKPPRRGEALHSRPDNQL